MSAMVSASTTRSGNGAVSPAKAGVHAVSATAMVRAPKALPSLLDNSAPTNSPGHTSTGTARKKWLRQALRAYAAAPQLTGYPLPTTTSHIAAAPSAAPARSTIQPVARGDRMPAELETRFISPSHLPEARGPARVWHTE